ncbi:hypothetical protein D3C72_1460500 [compost metagenome]
MRAIAPSGPSTTTNPTKARRAPCCRTAWTRARPTKPCAWPARRTPGRTRRTPGTRAAWATGPPPRRTIRWRTTPRPTCLSSTRWRAPSPYATPTTARSPAAPTPTACSSGAAPTTAWRAATARRWATCTTSSRAAIPPAPIPGPPTRNGWNAPASAGASTRTWRTTIRSIPPPDSRPTATRIRACPGPWRH